LRNRQIQLNLLNWKRVLLDMKELNIVLDENEFEREGGEITWSTETCIGFDSCSEVDEEQAEVGDPGGEEQSKIPDEVRYVFRGVVLHRQIISPVSTEQIDFERWSSPSYLEMSALTQQQLTNKSS
jgi:hypothetical protein